MVTVLLVYFVSAEHRRFAQPVLVEHAQRLDLGRRKRGPYHPRRPRFGSERATGSGAGVRPAGLEGPALVVVPQAMPVILPPYISLVTGLVQASSLGAVIGVNELLRSAQVLIEQTTLSRGGSPAYLVYGAILVVYFVLCWAISFVGRRLERRFGKPYRRMQAENGQKVDGAIVSAAVPLDVRT